MNRDAATLIAQGLRDGLVHPGDGTTKPIALPLPAFRTTGMPPELAEQVDKTTTLIAEAIIALIEQHTAMIDKTELAALRTAAELAEAQPSPTIAVHCRCDTTRRNPLLRLRVQGDVAVIDGRQLLTGLARRSADCPHPVT